MAKKTFYTERDVELLASQGVDSLVVNEDVYLTDVAREKAERLGIRLVREHETPASAPIRPYIAALHEKKPQAGQAEPEQDELYQQVRASVIRRLGDEIDHALLDTIIRRVLRSVGKG